MEMSDSEIISLLAEYNFKEKEIGVILKEIKDRDFESVLNFIEEKRKNDGNGPNNKMKEQQLKLEQRNKENKIIEARNKIYKERILQKIKANHEEQLQKEKEEYKDIGPIEKTVEIEANIKVMVLVNMKDDIILGFDKNATVNDLFDVLKKKLNVSNVKIYRHTNGEQLTVSNRLLVDEFKVTAVMVEAIAN